MELKPEQLQKNKFHTALFNLYNDVDSLKKKDDNPFFKSKYVSLPEMLEAIKGPLLKNGFILTQPVSAVNTPQGIKNVVLSRLINVETGFSEESSIALPECAPTMKGMQELGGAVTYARRYTLSALLGLREIDDDGNFTSGKTSTPAKKSKVSSQDQF